MSKPGRYFEPREDVWADLLVDLQKNAAEARAAREERQRLWPEFAHIDAITDAVVRLVLEEQYGVTADYIARRLARKWTREEVGAGLSCAMYLHRVRTREADGEVWYTPEA
jgi:hypothetical protein